MKSLKGRILLSYAIFGVLLLSISFIAFNFVKKTSDVRALQSEIQSIRGKALLLMDMDVTFRIEDILDPDFFRDSSYHKIKTRDSLYESLHEDIVDVTHIADNQSLYGGNERISDIVASLESYETTQQDLLAKLKKRGFRDEGLEGQMRTYAHELENHSSVLELSQLLSLRRHEKDYFLRSDTVYIGRFNRLCDEINASFKTANVETQTLLENYQARFNEIVAIETSIGNQQKGLIAEVAKKKRALIASLSTLSELVNERGNEAVKRIINKLILFVLVSLVLTTILGYLSAHFASASIKKLAQTMRRSIRSQLDGPMITPERLSAQETKSLYSSYEVLLSTLRTQLFDLEHANTALYGKNNELTRLIEIIQESEDSLKASNELKDKFFSIIAHDLKGPMGTLTMLLEYIAQQINHLSKEDTALYVNKLLDSATSISILLENLLNWARNQVNHLVAKPEEIAVKPMIEGIASLNKQRLVEKNIQLDNLVEDNVILYADKNMMDLVFRNLIDNAIKFTPENGRVTIESKVKKEKAHISFSDTGVGIDEKDQDKLFSNILKKQSTGTSGEKGIGLGLVLAFDFVRKNGGKLQVSSELDKGSTFTVKLPCASGQEKKKEALVLD